MARQHGACLRLAAVALALGSLVSPSPLSPTVSCIPASAVRMQGMSLPRVIAAVAGFGLALGMVMPPTDTPFMAGVRDRLHHPPSLAVLCLGLLILGAAIFPRSPRP